MIFFFYAIFLLYFPEFNELDIESTYQMEPEEQAAIGVNGWSIYCKTHRCNCK